MTIMKKNMYIQPDVQVTAMTGMQVMQGVSPFGGANYGGSTGENIGGTPTGD